MPTHILCGVWQIHHFMWCTALWLANIACCFKGNALHRVSDRMVFILRPLLASLTLSIKRLAWGLQLMTQPLTRLTEVAYLRGCMCFHWLSLYVIALVCPWFRLLVPALCLCVHRGASVCNAAANSLWLNHKLRAMRECCQFSTGEGLIHSVSDAINQIKHPSALLEEFVWSTYDGRECQVGP